MIEKNIREAFTFTPRIHLFGGEPTVNKDFIEIFRYFSRKKYIISMTSNGENIDEYVDMLSASPALKEIVISLNSMNFEKSLYTLNLFRNSRRRRNLCVTLACPINVKNQNILIDIVKRFEGSGINCIAFQHTTLTSHYSPTMNFVNIKKQVTEIKKRAFKIPVLFLPDIRSTDIEKYYSDPSFPRITNRCITPWVTPFIEPNGDVIPCSEVDMVMGNVKEERLKTIWNNERYRKFRIDIQKHGISRPVCARCCHRLYY
jgi:radical SAM protein with 4Fe4S-binding SPASM domain